MFLYDPTIPHLSKYTREMKTYVYGNICLQKHVYGKTCTPMFVAA